MARARALGGRPTEIARGGRSDENFPARQKPGQAKLGHVSAHQCCCIGVHVVGTGNEPCCETNVKTELRRRTKHALAVRIAQGHVFARMSVRREMPNLSLSKSNRASMGGRLQSRDAAGKAPNEKSDGRGAWRGSPAAEGQRNVDKTGRMLGMPLAVRPHASNRALASGSCPFANYPRIAVLGSTSRPPQC